MILLLPLVIGVMSSAQAYAPYTIQDICVKADLVVVAEVESTTALPASSAFGGVATEATLNILGIAKGPPLTTLEVIVPGGLTTAGLVDVSDWPLLAKGGRWFLILFTGADDKLWVLPDYGFQEIHPDDPVLPDPIMRQHWQSFCYGG